MAKRALPPQCPRVPDSSGEIPKSGSSSDTGWEAETTKHFDFKPPRAPRVCSPSRLPGSSTSQRGQRVLQHLLINRLAAFVVTEVTESSSSSITAPVPLNRPPNPFLSHPEASLLALPSPSMPVDYSRYAWPALAWQEPTAKAASPRLVQPSAPRLNVPFSDCPYHVGSDEGVEFEVGNGGQTGLGFRFDVDGGDKSIHRFHHSSRRTCAYPATSIVDIGFGIDASASGTPVCPLDFNYGVDYDIDVDGGSFRKIDISAPVFLAPDTKVDARISSITIATITITSPTGERHVAARVVSQSFFALATFSSSTPNHDMNSKQPHQSCQMRLHPGEKKAVSAFHQRRPRPRWMCRRRK
ncbi:hypothetical protein BDZ97DRAFT_1922095 [Flammula alnicola]|nr:hypothetical protein BDZ97DRAFT_1922095 [Flammula alnicola]